MSGDDAHSSSTATVAMQQKFMSVRRRLDQLGYRQPLGIESLPLVERLFADLVHTTESLKRARLGTTAGSSGNGGVGDGSVNSGGGGTGSHVLTDVQIDAYKSDNARLVRENNELHQQLMHAKEESEFALKGHWDLAYWLRYVLDKMN